MGWWTKDSLGNNAVYKFFQCGQREIIWKCVPTKITKLLPFLSCILKKIWWRAPVSGLWHEGDQFLYDVFYTPSGHKPIHLRSIAGLVPLLACTIISLRALPVASAAFSHHIDQHPQHVRRTDTVLTVLKWASTDLHASTFACTHTLTNRKIYRYKTHSYYPQMHMHTFTHACAHTSALAFKSCNTEKKIIKFLKH